MWRPSMRTLLLTLALALAASGPAAARGPSARSGAEAPRQQARKLGERAIRALNAEQYDKAVELLRQAEELFHAPTHLLLMARAYVELGQLLEAHEAYVAVVSERIPDYAPQPFHQAKRQAREELAELRQRLPTVQLSVRGVPSAQARITIDGKAIATPRLSQPIALAPGGHIIEASAEGHDGLSRRVELSAGDVTQQIELSFGAGDSGPTSGRGAEPALDEESSTSPFVASAVVAFGVGVAGLGVGAVTGGLTLSQASDIQDTCVDGHCPPEQQEEGDATTTLGNVSTAAFIIGGIGVVTGVVLLLVEPDDDDDERSADASASLRLVLAPTGFGLRGSF